MNAGKVDRSNSTGEAMNAGWVDWLNRTGEAINAGKVDWSNSTGSQECCLGGMIKQYWWSYKCW